MTIHLTPSGKKFLNNKKKALPEELTLEFLLEVPVPGGLGYQFDWEHFLSRIYFTLPIRWEKVGHD
ncbi:MAG: hypothetical protein GF308_05440 [Candidatus Heimdallarchaeota archaeon]|nr:hypothetical protein [Candidatus Heimdallarchaeota archaeon]